MALRSDAGLALPQSDRAHIRDWLSSRSDLKCSRERPARKPYLKKVSA